MKNLFIPPLGTSITLAQDWAFELHREHRNYDFFGHLGLQYPTWDSKVESVSATLPAGTILKIDRIYIRKGQKDYDSVTFHVVNSKGKKVTNARFWVKLADANKIMLVD